MDFPPPPKKKDMGNFGSAHAMRLFVIIFNDLLHIELLAFYGQE